MGGDDRHRCPCGRRTLCLFYGTGFAFGEIRLGPARLTNRGGIGCHRPDEGLRVADDLAKPRCQYLTDSPIFFLILLDSLRKLCENPTHGALPLVSIQASQGSWQLPRLPPGLFAGKVPCAKRHADGSTSSEPCSPSPTVFRCLPARFRRRRERLVLIPCGFLATHVPGVSSGRLASNPEH